MGIFGGSSDKSEKEAQQQADQQKADTQTAITGINSVFDDPARQAQYDKLGSDTTAYYTQDVNNQEAVNARQLKFAQARQGLTGSSVQAGEGAQLSQDYQKQLLQASQAGQSAEAGLKSSDEQSRMNLIADAEAGLDAGTSATQATTALQNNLLTGESGATANTLANGFGDLSQIYNNSQNQKALNSGLQFGYGGLFSSSAPTTGGGFNFG